MLAEYALYPLHHISALTEEPSKIIAQVEVGSFLIEMCMSLPRW